MKEFKILCVERDSSIAELYKLFFASFSNKSGTSFKTEAVPEKEFAKTELEVAAVAGHPYDAVICGISPEPPSYSGGLELLRLARALRENCRFILVVTFELTDAQLNELSALQASRLSKPFSLNDLEQLFQSVGDSEVVN